MKTASRTLVKSPPEVWEQLDHPGRMQGLMSALVGHATDVTVFEREEESMLAWRASDDAWIKVELAEKGWGTNVSVTAENGDAPTKLEGWLDAVIDELATPTKRPFEGMETSEHETPQPEPVPEPMPEPEPVPEPEPMPEPVPVPEPEAPQPVAAAVEEPPPAPEPNKKKKRFGFLGF
jgi:outer membrane biosynthesis protein TonB